MDAQRLSRLSRRRGGIFTRREARQCGYSSKQIRRRMRDGEWVAVIGSALAPAGLVVTPRLRDLAAHLCVTGSVLAGPSAARLWRFDVPDSRTYLYVGPSGRSSLPGARLLRSMPSPRDIAQLGAARLTCPPATVVDCLGMLPEPDALALLDRALLRRWITLNDLVDRVQHRAGRHGIEKIVRLMRSAVDGTRSAAERFAADLFRRNGITGWAANVPIHDANGLIGLGDFVFHQARLVVEVDGWAFHQDHSRFINDRERQNRLVQAGWTVLRITWYDLHTRPDYVVRLVKSALARAS